MSRPKPIYIQHAESPGYRQLHIGSWAWWVRDSATGPIVAQGHTLTEWGAQRAIERVARRCVCVAGTCRNDRPVQHPLTRQEIGWINAVLDLAGIPVEVTLSGTAVVMTPSRELTTEQEVRTLRTVLPKTDAPVRWAGVA
jgi:hypothetical protein